MSDGHRTDGSGDRRHLAARVDWAALGADADAAVLLRLAIHGCDAAAGGVSAVTGSAERAVVSVGPRSRPTVDGQSLAVIAVESDGVVEHIADGPRRRRPGTGDGRPCAAAPLWGPDGVPAGALWVVARRRAGLAPDARQTLLVLSRAISRRLQSADRRTASSDGAALARDPTRFDLLLDAVGAGYWDWNLDRGEVAITPRLAELLHLPPSPVVVPAMLFSALEEPELDLVHEAFDALFSRRDERLHVEFSLRTPDGEPEWVRLRGHVAAWAPNGQPARALGLAIDITGERRRDDERRAAQRLDALGALTAGVAHEINTPLQVVSHNLDFLASQAELGLPEATDAAVRRDMEGAIAESIDAIDRVSDIVRALKEFSHHGRGRIDQIEVNRTLEHAVTLTRHEWRRVATIERDLASDGLIVPGVAYECGQVFVNLIVNAAHAIAAGTTGPGRITLRSRPVGDMVHISVVDNGAGIPDELHGRLFDPFFTTKGPGQGSGLGLAASRAIVERYGGTIDFHSEFGRGTTFIVRLPIVGRASRAA